MGKRYALLIGNGRYRNFPGLQTPANNVKDLEKILADPSIGGFDVKIRRDASKDQVENDLIEFFSQKASDDLLVLYYAGHGIKQGRNLYLTFEETNPERPEETRHSISTSYIGNLIEEKCASQRIVVILDCCFAAKAAGAMGAGGSAETRNAFGSNATKLIILTASDELQPAWETDIRLTDSPYSVFTHFLIDGLRNGNADSNGNGDIAVDEWFEYAQKAMGDQHARQTPLQFGEPTARQAFIIASNPYVKSLPRSLEELLNHENPDVRNTGLKRLGEIVQRRENNPNQIRAAIARLEQAIRDKDDLVNREAKKYYLELMDIIEEYDPVEPSDDARLFYVFLSSPGDVNEERRSVRNAVNLLNRDADLRKNNLYIKLVAWDSPEPEQQVFLSALVTPQVSVNEQMRKPSECDLVLVIFWSRMGTPIPVEVLKKKDGGPYLSGTEWEYWDGIEGGRANNGHPEVILFRRTEVPQLKLDDPETEEKLEQYKRVSRFFEAFGSNTQGYNTYEKSTEFAQKIEVLLRRSVQTFFSAPTPAPSPKKTVVEYTLDDLLIPYLEMLVQTHSKLDLRGVRRADAPKVDLERVYVALKGLRSSSYIIGQSRELQERDLRDYLSNLSGEQDAESLIEAMRRHEQDYLIDNPISLSLTERDRPIEGIDDQAITLGDAFRRERYLVILGDPGSGKTTLARWLAIKLAIALLDANKPEEVTVPRHQVDPDVEMGDEVISLGKPRLPILIRISDYSEAFANARAQRQTLSVADYLGQFPWMGNLLPAEGLNQLMKAYLRDGRAVVILDGMDELVNSADRDDIVQAIEVFVEEWIIRRGGLTITSTYTQLARITERAVVVIPRDQGAPIDTGGNQIIITSRITGYHALKVKLDMTHVTIQKMKRAAVEHFCDMWMLAVYSDDKKDEPEWDVSNEATRAARKLRNEIFDPNRPRLRELASNPLLVTILAIVHYKFGKLPQHRSQLYRLALEVFVEDWRSAGLEIEEIIFILAPIAARLHQNVASGLIGEQQLRSAISAELEATRKYPSKLEFERAVNNFMDKIRVDVGLLAAHAESEAGTLYKFLHLTFQEYLAAHYLLREPSQTAFEIIQHLDDPRWREPILLALGEASLIWREDDFEKLLQALLEEDKVLGDLLPRTPLLIVNALDEMQNVSARLIREVARRLLKASADFEGSGRFDTLHAEITTALAQLHSGQHQTEIDHVLADTLRKPDSPALAPAAATLIMRNDWFTPDIIQALLDGLVNDLAEWGWVIHRAIQFVVTPPHELKPPVEPKDLTAQEWQKLRENNYEKYLETRRRFEVAKRAYSEKLELYNRLKDRPPLRLPDGTLGFRKRILELMADGEVTIGTLWLRVVAALYGGFYDYQAPAVLREYIDLARFLQQSDNFREAALSREREEMVGQWGADDPIYNIAVYLDTGMGGKLPRANQPPEFEPRAIYRDSTLTQRIIGILRQGKPATDLIKPLWDIWNSPARPTEARIDALIALMALGENVITVIEAALTSGSDQVLGQQILARLSRMSQTLDDTVTRALRKLQKELLTSLADKLSPDEWEDVFYTLTTTQIAYCHLPFDPTEYLDAVPQEHLPYVLAEFWVYRLLGAPSDDIVYNLAVALDTMQGSSNTARATAASRADIILSLTRLHETGNLHYDGYPVQWTFELLPPVWKDKTDIPLEVLDAVESVHIEAIRPDLRNVTVSTFLNRILAYAPAQLLPELAALNWRNSYDRDAIFTRMGMGRRPKAQAILEMARTLNDPYYRARAILRIGRLIRKQRREIILEARKVAEEITDAHRRCRVLEGMLPYFGGRERADLLENVIEVANQITDPDDRARALGRLAQHHFGETRQRLMQSAIESARQVEDTKGAARLIAALRPFCTANIDLLRQLNQTAQSISNEWDRAKALGLRGAQLAQLEQRFGSELGIPLDLLNLVTLGALVNDTLSYFTNTQNVDGLWWALNEDPTPEKVEALMRARMVDGLTLTQTAANVFSRLLQQDESLYRPMLPMLQNPTPDAMPIVEEWLEHWDEIVADHAALYLAEQERTLSEQNIPQLTHLVELDYDRSRYRAALVLHGTTSAPRKSDARRMMASENMDVLRRSAKMRLKYRAEKPRVALIFGWFWSDVYFDTAESVETFVADIENSTADADAAAIVLEFTEAANEEAIGAMIEAFKRGHPQVQKALFRGIARFYHLKNASAQLNEFLPEMLSLASPELRDTQVMADTFLYMIARAADKAKENNAQTLEDMRAALSDAREYVIRPVGELLETRSDLQALMKTIGSSFYAQTDTQWGVVLAIYDERPTIYTAMIEWLTELLREDILDDPMCFLRSELLTAVAVVAKAHPDVFANVAEKTGLIQYLSQVALYHNTFPGRAAAMEMLSYLRQMSVDAFEVIRSGLREVSAVRERLLGVVSNFRHYNREILDLLVKELTSDSAIVAYTSAQLLSALGRSDRTPAEDRRRILYELAKAVRDPRSHRGIYETMGGGSSDEDFHRIQCVGRLDHEFHAALVTVVGSLKG